jgi:hypothetical protein
LKEVAAMPPTEKSKERYTLLLDRLRHGVQYAEACRVPFEDAIALLEAATREKEDDDA